MSGGGKGVELRVPCASACIYGGGANSDGTGVTRIGAGVHQRAAMDWVRISRTLHSRRESSPGWSRGDCVLSRSYSSDGI
eukprot:1159500-Rhodomonas_salina.1